MSIFTDRSGRQSAQSWDAQSPVSPKSSPGRAGVRGTKAGAELAWNRTGGFGAHLMAARRAGGAPTGSAPGAPLIRSAGVRGWLQVLLSLSRGPAP